MAATLTDLLRYCKAQAIIEATNYFDPHGRDDFNRDGRTAWRQDARERDRQRLRCHRDFPARLRKGTEPLVPGTYGRLTIDANGKCDYTVGQYAALEIYDALYNYLKETNNV